MTQPNPANRPRNPGQADSPPKSPPPAPQDWIIFQFSQEGRTPRLRLLVTPDGHALYDLTKNPDDTLTVHSTPAPEYQYVPVTTFTKLDFPMLTYRLHKLIARDYHLRDPHNQEPNTTARQVINQEQYPAQLPEGRIQLTRKETQTTLRKLMNTHFIRRDARQLAVYAAGNDYSTDLYNQVVRNLKTFQDLFKKEPHLLVCYADHLGLEEENLQKLRRRDIELRVRRRLNLTIAQARYLPHIADTGPAHKRQNEDEEVIKATCEVMNHLNLSRDQEELLNIVSDHRHTHRRLRTRRTWQVWKHILTEYCRHNPAGENREALRPIAQLVKQYGNQELLENLLTWPEYARRAEAAGPT